MVDKTELLRELGEVEAWIKAAKRYIRAHEANNAKHALISAKYKIDWVLAEYPKVGIFSRERRFVPR